MKKRILSALLSVMLIACLLPVSVSAVSGAVDLDKIYQDTGKYMAGLATTSTPIVGSVGGEWLMLGLARSGYKIPEDIMKGYYANVEAEVTSKINNKEQLHKNKATENERVIVALTSLDYDVTNVAGHNLLQGLTDMKYLQKQGINGPIWGLIAFDCGNYEIPTALEGQTQVTREALIEYVLGKQLADGGWALSGTSADPDMTGMALQALAPYYKKNETVKAAVDNAVICLSSMQKDDGGYASWGTVNSESCAQVIVALTALGIDPATDSRFVKNGKSVVDAMATFAIEGGGFCHVMNGGVNGMATEQGYYALAAYYRFKEGKTSLYDMTDLKAKPEPQTPAAPETKPETPAATTGNGTPSNAGNKPSASSPNTGDGSMAVTYSFLLLASAVCLVLLGKKKEIKE